MVQKAMHKKETSVLGVLKISARELMRLKKEIGYCAR